MKNFLTFLGIALFLAFITGSFFPLFIFFIISPFIFGTFSENKGKNGLEDFFKSFEKKMEKKNGRKFVENASNNFDFNKLNFNMENFNYKTVFSGLGIFIFILIIIDGIVNVPAGHVGVIFDRGRGVLEESLGEGVHLKIPFWQKSTIMNTRIQSYTMSNAKGEGNNYGDDAIEALTKDGQKIKVDMTIQFHLGKNNAPKLYQEIGLNYVEKIIRPSSRSVSREVITAYTSKDLFTNSARQEVQSQIEEKMKTYMDGKNLNLDGVLVRNIKFSDIYLNSIEEKQIAEQKIQKAEFEKKEAVIRKEKTIIEAEAEAAAIKLKGQALSKNKGIIQLEMVNKLSPNIKWGVLPDGVLPLLDLKNMKN